MNKYGRSLKIFVMGAEFHGLKSVELSNWTGLAHIGKREHISTLRKNEVFSSTGIYLLTCSDESTNGQTKLYIGETDNFVKRISAHANDKDWWDTFIVFTSKDLNLTKAHVKHLEKELHILAKESLGTIELTNSTEPTGAKLPDSDIADMSEFIENLLFVIETLGLGLFARSENNVHEQVTQAPQNDLNGTDFVLVQKRNQNLPAKMVVENEKYILKKGSCITKSPTQSFIEFNGYIRLWNSITKSDAVVEDSQNNRFVTTRDITFSSPSAAGAVVFGCSTNGRTAWIRLSDNKTLGECQIESTDDIAA